MKVNGDVVTITVPIDCAGCKGKTGPDGAPLAKYWEKAAEQAWNQGFAAYGYCSHYTFKLDVQIHAKDENFAGKDGDHRIETSTGNPNGRLVPPPGFEQHSASAYDQDFDGAWDTELPANGIAHEVGHLLGLGDDYQVVGTNPRVTRPKPGRENSMMADGGPVDQTNIDRIGTLLEKMGLIEKCRTNTWNGTVKVHVTDSSGAGTCIGDWTGKIILKVRGKSGTGTTTVTDAPVNSCGKTTFARVGQRAPFQADRVVNGFNVDTAYFVSASSTARLREVDRNHVRGKATTSIPYPDGEFEFVLTFDLRCADCR